ncbi:hypothetical protein [Mesorhizobium sp.]|uniref:hypothetical protein n=1 Tax=Mesorhizobium sp. TaxID=1871066 RepID=UPI0025BA863D|nr:hypothetical protein [Mesorhizobium sp.]
MLAAELVLKLFNQIGEEIAADPELAPDPLEPFKSKGIADLEDGTLVIRAKFTAKPGKQSAIRRAAQKAVHNAFRENGIRAMPKPTSDQGQWLSRDSRSQDVGYLSGTAAMGSNRTSCRRRWRRGLNGPQCAGQH